MSGWTVRWVLVHKDGGREVKVNEVLKSASGEKFTYKSGVPPHKSSSTGKILVVRKGFERIFYPGVFNLKWKENH